MTTGRIEDILQEVDDLLDSKRHAPAEERLGRLLRELGKHEASDWEADLRKLIERFYKKRRRDLLLILESKIGKQSHPDIAIRPADAGPTSSLQTAIRDFKAELDKLAAFHIFQWATYYRETFSIFFSRFLVLAEAGESEATSSLVAKEIARHAQAIFEGGYTHQVDRNGLSHADAMRKAQGGLERFLEIPLEAYVARVGITVAQSDCVCLREIGSAFLGSILLGFGRSRLGRVFGVSVLVKNPGAWLHVVPFLNYRDIVALGEEIRASEPQFELLDSCALFGRGIDLVCGRSEGFAPLPILAQYLPLKNCLICTLRPPEDSDPPSPIETHLYLGEGEISREDIDQAYRASVAVLVAALRPDLLEYVRRNDGIARMVVAIHSGEPASSLAGTLCELVQGAIFHRRTRRDADAPLTYNFAREFPLRNPNRLRYFRVARSSVRDLLRTFDRRNGVRLWCSVRRSGKTTACFFDLSTTTAGSAVVSQTCDSTEQFPNANLLYEEICGSLDSGRSISKDFLMKLVSRCAPPATSMPSRYVLVLDEYETLFGRLRSALRRDPDVRYMVVQPLLNQMVAFSRDNLLVFMGQQPNAHYIMMDQNQLSPYVEQDPFPLFWHNIGSTRGEFSDLVRKVITERVTFDDTFADALFRETAGHPFLTVNVLVELVDWLVEIRKPARGLRLMGPDFEGFAEARLTKERLQLSSEYDFFRAVAADATSIAGREANPWLWSVYSVIREIGRRRDRDASVTIDEYHEIVRALGVPDIGVQSDELLRTATQSNFLTWDDQGVAIRIRVLGRIVGTVRPNLSI